MKISIILTVFLAIFTLHAKAEDAVQVQKLKRIYELFQKLPSSELLKREPTAYNKQKEPIFKELSSYIDYDYVTLAAFPEQHQKKFWKKEKDRKVFQALLKELIEEVVYVQAKKFVKKIKITFHPEVKQQAEDYITRTTILFEAKSAEEEDEEFEVQYYFRKKGDQWVIRDIIFDDEGWMPMFRDQFNKFLQDNKDDYAKLLKEMKDKLAKAKRGESIFDNGKSE